MKAKNREIITEKEQYALKETKITYSTNFYSNKLTLSSETPILLETLANNSQVECLQQFSDVLMRTWIKYERL